MIRRDWFCGFVLFKFNNAQSSQVCISLLVSIVAVNSFDKNHIVKFQIVKCNACDPAISPWGIYPMDILRQVYRNICTRMFIVVIARN